MEKSNVSQVSDGPTTDPGTPSAATPTDKPCGTCGEPRPDGSATCPHCGLP